MKSATHEQGFTLIDVTVGSAIAIVVLSILVSLVHYVAANAAHLNARLTAQSAATTLLERLQSDASSAWALWIPTSDVLGKANGDGHELDFFTQDTSHRTYAWAYCFDAASQTVTRYAYAPSTAAVPGESYVGIGTFAATEFSPADLANPASGIYDPLFAAANVTEQQHAFGIFANANGGNDLYRVQIAAGGLEIDQTLASATAPSHFTVIVQYTPSPAPAATAAPTPFPLGAFTPVPTPT